MVGSYTGLGGDSGASRTRNTPYVDQALSTLVGIHIHSFIIRPVFSKSLFFPMKNETVKPLLIRGWYSGKAGGTRMARPWYHTKETAAGPSSVFWAALHILRSFVDRNRRGRHVGGSSHSSGGSSFPELLQGGSPAGSESLAPTQDLGRLCHLVTG